MTLTAVLVGQVLLTACAGAARLAGVVGATVDQDGEPVLLVAACGGPLDTVQVFAEPGSGPTPRPPLGVWRRGVEAGELAELPFTAPAPAGWTVSSSPAAFPELLRATGTGPGNWSSRQVSFSTQQLRELGPGTVLTGSGPLPRDDFHARACEAVER